MKLKCIKSIELTEKEEKPLEIELGPIIEESLLKYGISPIYVRFRNDGTKYNKSGGKNKQRLMFYGFSVNNGEIEVYDTEVISLEDLLFNLGESSLNKGLESYFNKPISVEGKKYLEIPYGTDKVGLMDWNNKCGDRSEVSFCFYNGKP